MTTLTQIEEQELKDAIIHIVKRDYTEDELKLIDVKFNSGTKTEPVYLTTNSDGSFVYELNIEKLNKTAKECTSEDYVNQIKLVFGLVEVTALIKFYMNHAKDTELPAMPELIKTYVTKMEQERESTQIEVLMGYVAK